MAEQFCLKWNNHQSTIISNFDTLLETQKHVDCSLAADGKVLRAHKVVLSACSPYLEQLLNHEKDKYPVLVFSDVKFDYLKAMLDYMYRGEVNVLQEHLNGFLKAAETLQIKGLTDQGGGGGGGGSVGGGGGGEMKRKQPARIAEMVQPASPVQERSMSPTVPAKRRRQRRLSQEQLSDSHVDTSNSCDIPTVPPPAAVTKPQVETDRLSNSVLPPAPAPAPPLQPKLEPVDTSVVQPKTELIDDTNDEQIEDLTLDDDDDDGYMAKPGSSHGNDSQGFDSTWFSGETSNPDMFLGAQDPSGNQNNSQGEGEAVGDGESETQAEEGDQSEKGVEEEAKSEEGGGGSPFGSKDGVGGPSFEDKDGAGASAFQGKDEGGGSFLEGKYGGRGSFFEGKYGGRGSSFVRKEEGGGSSFKGKDGSGGSSFEVKDGGGRSIFECKICKKIFQQETFLARHSRVHMSFTL